MNAVEEAQAHLILSQGMDWRFGPRVVNEKVAVNYWYKILH